MHGWCSLKCRWHIRYLWEAVYWTRNRQKQNLLAKWAPDRGQADRSRGKWRLTDVAVLFFWSQDFPTTAQIQMKKMFSREEGGIHLKDGRGRAGIQGDSILENRVEIRRVFNYPPLGQMVVLVKWAWSSDECMKSVGVVRPDWMYH